MLAPVGYTVYVRRLFLLVVLTTLQAPSVALASSSQGAAVSCSVSSYVGGAISGQTLTMSDGTVSTLTFSCPGSTQAPVFNGSLGSGVSISPAVQSGTDWTFTITTTKGQGGSMAFVFTPDPAFPVTTVTYNFLINVTTPPTDKPTEPGGGGGTPTGSGVCGSNPPVNPQPNEQPAVQGDISARMPGESSFSDVPDNKLCVTMIRFGSGAGAGPESPSEQVSVSVVPMVSAWPYPEGTVFRVSGELTGFKPLTAGGGMDEPAMLVEGEKFTVQAKAVKVRSAINEAACASARPLTVLAFSVSPRLSGPGAKLSELSAGSNGYSFASPQIQGNKLFFDALGCGDGDPGTLDGFINAQMSGAFLATLGISQAVLRVADSSSVASMINVGDSGKASRVSFEKEQALDGTLAVRMKYLTSFSRTQFKVGANKNVVAFAKKCAKKKKAKLRRQGKTMTCKPKKGKSSKLAV